MSCKELFDRWLLKDAFLSKVMIWEGSKLVYDSDLQKECEYEDEVVLLFSCSNDKDSRKDVLNITL